MEPLSRNKKIGILSLVVLSLTLVWLFLTGNLSFSGLKSDVLNQTCTEVGQQKKLSQYTAFVKNREQAQQTLDLVSGEILVLHNKIAEQNTLIAQKEQEVVDKKAKFAELETLITKSCRGRLVNSAACRANTQKKNILVQELKVLNSSLAVSKTTVNQLSNQIKSKENSITQQTKLITRYTLFINQYEACDRQLLAKPLLTSPLMSGEAMISWETLVAGEVTLIWKTFISGEVLMTGEPCAGEVRVPLYRLAISVPYPGWAQIDWINFNTSFGDVSTDKDIVSGNIGLKDFFFTEEWSSEPLYKCFFLDNNLLNCLPSGNVINNWDIRNYILSAKVTGITAPWSFKVYGGNIAYNGGKGDSINQTTPITINYDPILSCSKPSITVLSPNGGENT